MPNQNSLRLYIHASGERCAAKGMHRSGNKLRPISTGDILHGSDDAPCGIVISAGAELIDRENWLYRVEYTPKFGTVHPLGGFVVWSQEPVAVPPIIPAPIADRIAGQPNESNGTKTKKVKKKVTGQQGNGVLANATNPTA